MMTDDEFSQARIERSQYPSRDCTKNVIKVFIQPKRLLHAWKAAYSWK